MEKSTQKPDLLIGLVQSTELKVAVKRFVISNIIRLATQIPDDESVSDIVAKAVIALTNNALDEIVASLSLIEAQNEKAARGGKLDA